MVGCLSTGDSKDKKELMECHPTSSLSRPKQAFIEFCQGCQLWARGLKKSRGSIEHRPYPQGDKHEITGKEEISLEKSTLHCEVWPPRKG